MGYLSSAQIQDRIAYEGDNTTDVYSHDLGFVAHFEGGALEGFTVLAGGSLGQTTVCAQVIPGWPIRLVSFRPIYSWIRRRRQCRSVAISATARTVVWRA
jgi:hypothetical protein